MRAYLLYVLLVGIPGLALFGVLEFGRSVEAPRSIGGTWLVDPLPANACAVSGRADTVRASREQWHISQSGVRAELLWRQRARAASTIQLRGDSVTGSLRFEGDASCAGRTLRLRAVIAKVTAGDLLSGTMRVEDCGDCLPLPIHASRAATPARES